MKRQVLSFLSCVLVAGLAGCNRDSTGPTNPSEPTPQYIQSVEVVYHSYQDHDPEANDWVTFNVTLANPDGSTRECGLQSTAIRPYGSDCPTVGSTVDKIGPSTFRAVLYNVWVNSRPEDAKHVVTAGERVGGRLPFLETGNNLEIARAYDEEVRIIGHCSNCVYEQVQGRFFRVR